MSRAFLVAPGFERSLLEEVTGGSVIAPGVVLADDAAADDDPVFARQVLPGALEVRGASVAKLAQGAVPLLLPALEAPWRLDPIAPDDAEEPGRASILGSRADLVGERFLAELKERRRKVLKTRVDDPKVTRVQLLLTERELLLVSAADPIQLASGARWPSPFPAGRTVIEEDKEAPSRAHRKLREALAWMDLAIGRRHRCVDLGAAPGGWSWVAAAAGAQVIAVDRAELDRRLLAGGRVEHVRADALKFEPDDPPVDWLFCDVIAEPKKSLELLERWLDGGWFKSAVFQLKFKGEDRAPPIRDARALLRRYPVTARIKHLHFDRNEVTMMISRGASRG